MNLTITTNECHLNVCLKIMMLCSSTGRAWDTTPNYLGMISSSKSRLNVIIHKPVLVNSHFVCTFLLFAV